MRLFVAISIPQKIQQQLAQQLMPFPEGVRPSRGAWHLTLKFLGECSKEKLEEIKKELLKVKTESFELKLAQVKVLPSLSRPRVLCVTLKNSESLKILQKKIEKNLCKLAFEKEKRPFLPHLTVGRFKKFWKGNLQSFLKREELLEKNLENLQVKVEKFFLYSSKLEATGAKHQLEASFRLK